MSSVVFNANAVGKSQIQNAIELFPTTIGGATKMYQRYQHIMPAPEQKLGPGPGAGAATGAGAGAGAGTGVGINSSLAIKTRKYTPRGSQSCSSASSSSSSLSPYNVDQSQSVQRRNARERNRVKQVNNSFARLRQHIPQTIIADLTKGGGRGPHKKISKVDTLRIAVEYIRRLQDLVDDLNGGPSATSGSSSSSNSNSTQFNLCLDETSSSSTASSSVSSLGHNLYYSSSLLATASASASASATATPTPLQQQQQLQRQQFPNHPLTPISLNASNGIGMGIGIGATAANSACHSPTSSFNSSMSFDSGTYEAAPQQLSPPVANSTSPATTASLDAQLQLKFEPYEHFQLDEEDCTPDDEEILDYISLWQEQ
ncbi:hypothetical protein ACLKA6_019238 [Drosophila palustris]